MAQGNGSIFDASAFMETNYKVGDFPTDWLLPDAGDYPAQIAAPGTREPISYRIGTSATTGNVWCSIDVSWKLTDENVARKLNMEEVYVRQSFMVDLQDGSTEAQPRIDLGQNRSQRLKDLWKATGLLGKKGTVNMNSLKFATALVHVEHRRPDGFDRDIAEVTRVTAL